jgi:pimeloyl-ACP methyl ester carboxylesterase
VSSEPARLGGLLATEHTFTVPLDHANPSGPKLEVFVRELADPDGLNRPFLVYFQGGPGFEAERPTSTPWAPSWLKRALRDYRVLMLDQRGTGRSTPVGALSGMTPQQQADYLRHFRADAIVADAEIIRRALDAERWSVLGQSFGGFCVTAYLSTAPDGLREAFITGGLPPLALPVDEIYACTYRRTAERNRRYRTRYPEDQRRLSALRARLEEESMPLPSGDPLTWRRLRQLGAMLGMSNGAERLHYILELPPDSPAFRHDVQSATTFARNPIYAILHEAGYADGGATRWSAHRMLPDEFEQEDLLTGEHVYPWMFEEYGALAPLREAAELLAAQEWPRLYNRDVLSGNEVPAAAAIYTEDMYVERVFSEQTAATIRGLRPWVTSEYDHNGLRIDGERILGRLIDLARGRV